MGGKDIFTDVNSKYWSQWTESRLEFFNFQLFGYISWQSNISHYLYYTTEIVKSNGTSHWNVVCWK